MSITRCPNGHFFDPESNDSCPWCAVPADEQEWTKRLPSDAIQWKEKSGSSGSTFEISSRNNGNSGHSLNEELTVAVVKRKTGIDPVVGWLVCIKGPDRGRDFRIRSEKNSLGRANSMDICVTGDETISRANHAFIVYDPKKTTFRIQAGMSRGLVYLNGDEVVASELLNPYDRIEIGESVFLFIPLCGENFQWEKTKDD